MDCKPAPIYHVGRLVGRTAAVRDALTRWAPDPHPSQIAVTLGYMWLSVDYITVAGWCKVHLHTCNYRLYVNTESQLLTGSVFSVVAVSPTALFIPVGAAYIIPLQCAIYLRGTWIFPVKIVTIYLSGGRIITKLPVWYRDGLATWMRIFLFNYDRTSEKARDVHQQIDVRRV